MNKESLLKNSVLSVVYTIGIGLLAFVINKVFSEQLGQESLGLLRLFTQLVAYLGVAELGVSAAAIALLFKPLSENDTPTISSILYTVDWFYKIITVSVLVAGLALNMALPFLIDEVSTETHVIWSLYVFGTSLTYFLAKYHIIFTADQKYGYLQNVRNAIKILVNIGQLLVLIYLQSFYLFVFLIIVGNVIELALLRFKYFNTYSFKECSKVRNNSVLVKTKQVFIHKLAGVLIFNTDYLIIAKFVGLKSIAVYSSYLMVLNFIQLIVNNIAHVITPRVGELYASKSKEFLRDTWNNIYMINGYLASLIVSILYFTLDDFVALWMGPDFYLSELALIGLMINMYVETLRKTLDIFIISSGFYNYTHLPVIEGVLNFILSISLVQYYGVAGVIWGTVISNLLITLTLKPKVVFFHIIRLRFDEYLMVTLKHLIRLAVSLALISLYNKTNDLLLDFLSVSMISFISVTIVYSFSFRFRTILRAACGFFARKIIG